MQKRKLFYCKSHLATATDGTVQRSIVQSSDLLLAQINDKGGVVEPVVLASDRLTVPLGCAAVAKPADAAYQ
jgi:hypothetical protein